MFKTSSFDKLLEKATSNLLLEPDWPTIIQICDLIRQNDVQPKYVIGAIKKKLYSPNPHCAMYALLVLESIVKNCGSGIHNEVASKETCEMLRELAKSSPHENVRQKVLELIQAWAFAFRNKPKYRAVQDIMNIMKTDGYKFPQLNESDAMFMADSAPEWADGNVCHRCRVPFSLFQRKHHCRACGQVFCNQCCEHTATIPKFGIEKEVRVCEACFEQLNKPTPATSKVSSEGDLPAEYVSSSLAQQNQSPPRKTEEELREEEELQLAIALSQSEAEHKEKEKKRITSSAGRSFSPAATVNRSPSPKLEETDPELARYLNRSYWEQRQGVLSPDSSSPSAPSQQPTSVKQSSSPPISPVGGLKEASVDPEMDDFVNALKSQVEIFVNRMKSNSSRGRSIANDSSVQTLFMNITAMHSKLLRYIQQQDDARLRYEGLQDKLSQVKDARAALDALREEHLEQLRREAEEAERQRQLQMAHKLEIMRKKKQEYLQYQRQLALQRIQEQEREMQMRQEQQKQQYLMGSNVPFGYVGGSPVHMPGNMPAQYQTMPGANSGYAPGYPYGGMMPPPGTPGMMPQMQPQPPNVMTSSSQPYIQQSPMMQGPPQMVPNNPMMQQLPPQQQPQPQPQQHQPQQQPQLQPQPQPPQLQSQPPQLQPQPSQLQPQPPQLQPQPPPQTIPVQVANIEPQAPPPQPIPAQNPEPLKETQSQTAQLISFD